MSLRHPVRSLVLTVLLPVGFVSAVAVAVIGATGATDARVVGWLRAVPAEFVAACLTGATALQTAAAQVPSAVLFVLVVAVPYAVILAIPLVGIVLLVDVRTRRRQRT